MIRSLIVLIAMACGAVIVPAAAQDDVPPAGRYQLAPGEGGSFVRLDTRTGAISHCRQQDGVWHCQPIVDSGVKDEVRALSDRVDRLSTDLDRLSQRVDTLAADAALPAPPAASAGTADGPPRKPHGFAQTIVYRLLEMVRTLKHGHADTT